MTTKNDLRSNRWRRRLASRARPAPIAALALLAAAVTARAGTLAVDQVDQEKSQWCWAACCEATLRFYGVKATQTQIAEYGTGGSNVWNYLYGSGTPSEDGIYRRGCDLVLDHFGAVDSDGYTGTLSLSALQAEIDAARPVFVNWEWDGGGGHILLARGVVNSNVYLMDPWYGASVNDYDWVCNGGGHTWKWTLELWTESTVTNDVPRWWLGFYDLTNGWAWDSLAADDQDEDSVPTWQEYVADTDPTNDVSRLALTNISLDGGNLRVHWQGGTGAWQYLEWADALTNTSWTVITSCVPPTASGDSATDSVTNGPGFYRIRVAR
ncbi:MAG: C39 family peptidase [Kiritimatiellae bacterium]|nr:C39 family peptidase [Kiritimatiellia bacterium]